VFVAGGARADGTAAALSGGSTMKLIFLFLLMAAIVAISFQAKFAKQPQAAE
jgi:hypothetical protein